ncbi:MAG: hypothetical protein R6X19_00525 [Kiritimatiellia bacterium]
MSAHARFHLHTLGELTAELTRRGLQPPLSANLSILGTALPIGSRSAPNRFAVQPMEGFDAADDNGPGPLSFRRYARHREPAEATRRTAREGFDPAISGVRDEAAAEALRTPRDLGARGLYRQGDVFNSAARAADPLVRRRGRNRLVPFPRRNRF